MTSTTKRRLMQQGFTVLDHASLERFGPWFKLAPALCAAITLTGAATGSWLLLWALAPAGLIAARTGKHPADRIYDLLVRPRLGRNQRLPRYRTPRRFAFGLSSAGLVVAGVALLLGAAALGTALALLLGGALLLAATTRSCPGCILYHWLRKARARRSMTGLPPRAQRPRLSAGYWRPGTDPRIQARRIGPIRRSVYD